MAVEAPADRSIIEDIEKPEYEVESNNEAYEIG